MEIDLRKKLNDVYDPFLDDRNRFLVMYGGAGSGKSVFAVQKILYRILTEQNSRFLVIRKVARTLRNSCYSLFQEMISDWGLNDLAKSNKTDMVITFETLNSSVLFLGLDDVEKLKSISGITSIWIEEASEITADDFKQVNLRLRGETKGYKQIMLTFNPVDSQSWLKRHFFDSPVDGTKTILTTYKDNRFIDDQYKKELEALLEIDKNFYNIYCLGQWGSLENVVFSNWEVMDLSDIKDQYNAYYYGLDFGYTNDPTAFIKCAVKDDTIYIMDEFYEHELTNDKIAGMLTSRIGSAPIFCDSAEPKSIAELRNGGINAHPVKKGKDSVIHGIQWLKQKKIVVDKTCQNVINELSGYQWRKTKDDVILNEPVDMNNHLIDALRYALEFMIVKRIVRVPGFSADSLGI